MPRRFSVVLALGCAALLAATGARADEVRVLAAGAAKHALETLAPGFEQRTGHRLRASFDTVGAQRDRVLQAAPGAVADVVVLSEAALEQLRAAGRPLPDISDAAHLRQALLDAPSIAYADPARGATAGTHFARTVEALGLKEALAGKTTVLPFGGDVIEAVAQGRFALGVSQSSEISNHPGVRLVGALPPPHAQGTGYGAALASEGAAGRALLAYLDSPEGRAAWATGGFTR